MDYEAEYNNRARVPGHPQIIARWMSDAQAYRSSQPCELDIAYAAREHTRLDLFRPQGDDPRAPVALFVHGGYWQTLDRKAFSHVARGLNSRGAVVAVAGYDLCPAVTVAAIVEEIRDACAFLWRRTQRPVCVYGHSAGGHLAAAMLATDWPARDSALAAGLVPAAYAISGVFDLVPLVATSINGALGLDEDAARAVSPAEWDVPAGRSLIAAVGAEESSEFLRQSRDICEIWGSRGVTATYREIEGADHFTVLDPLPDPKSAMVEELWNLVSARPGARP